MFFVALLTVNSLLASVVPVNDDAVPFLEALDRAAIQQERLDDVLEHGLIIGNGDINALLYARDSHIVLSLTKNDVWDARLLTENDPPLPTIKRLKELVADGWPTEGNKEWILPDAGTYDGQDSYHAHPFPCPLQCAEVVFHCGVGDSKGAENLAVWRAVRTQGSLNEFNRTGTGGTMQIEGKAGDSNGYQCSFRSPSASRYSALLVRVKGSSNARFFVEILDDANKSCFSSGWQDTPGEITEFAYSLPTDRDVGAIILYTWTKDGRRAENAFEGLLFKGSEDDWALPFGFSLDAPMRSRLSLEKAAATIDGIPDKLHGVTVRALSQKNVFLIETDAAAQLRAVTPDFLPAAQETMDGNVACIVQTTPGDLDWPGMSYAVALAQSDGKAAVSIVTSLESEHPKEAALALARAALEEETAAAIKEHESAWREYWNASGVVLADRVLEQNWYRSLYFLRCVTKPGATAPGLFAGLINATPAWHGDYHLNYNLQQTFWSAYIANHCELAEPYDRLIRRYLPRGEWLARQVYDCDGAFYPHVLYAYEPENPETCVSVNGRQYIHHVWGLTLGVAGFAVQPLWWRYKYAPDVEMLRTLTYPPLREVARFYASFIEDCETRNGAAHLGPSVSPEHWGWTANLDRNYDCAFDIALVRYTLEAAIEAAGVLETDEDLAAQWRAALQLLPPYPITDGEDPIVVDVAGAPPMEYNISVPATPVYPGDVVTWWSDPAEKALFKRTIDALQWNGNNATFMLAISRARLSMPETDRWLRDEITARQRPNGTLTLNRLGHHFNAFGHYTEQFGAAQAVSELLLQSVGDILRIFPAWPLDQPAWFRQLRAQGGFLVSGACENGQMGAITIQSTVGGMLRVLSPWDRTVIQCGADRRLATLDDQGVIALHTQAGEVILLEQANP